MEAAFPWQDLNQRSPGSQYSMLHAFTAVDLIAVMNRLLSILPRWFPVFHLRAQMVHRRIFHLEQYNGENLGLFSSSIQKVCFDQIFALPWMSSIRKVSPSVHDTSKGKIISFPPHTKLNKMCMSCEIQGARKRYANLVKQQPGRARQNS